MGAPHEHRWVAVRNGFTIHTRRCARCGAVEVYVGRRWLRLDPHPRRVD
jgi:hypothetical protein